MEHDFAEHLMDFIRRMPPDIPIMRITTDTLDDELIAPKWHMAKGQFIDYVNQQMTCREWKQGDLWRGHDVKPKSSNVEEIPSTLQPFNPVTTTDGSTTFWNADYKEHYHTPAGARLEAEEKYIVPSKLRERLALGDVALLDVCFGLGYNSLSALNAMWQDAASTLSITALEMDRRVVGAAAQNIQSREADAFDWRKTLSELYRHGKSAIGNRQSAIIHWGDARHTVSTLDPNAYDLVYLDAFSTQRNSELWTVDFFRKLKAVMKPDGVLLTYCAAIPVRAGLLEAGFFVGETAPVGRQRGGTLAALRAEDIEIPLPDHETKMIRDTTRGLPYRDPYGVWTNKEILRDRQDRIIQSKQEDSSNR
jgi:tRNA U34 5-methylaminomethyl-2-thiouridine-forming methyltransferase MnmC